MTTEFTPGTVVSKPLPIIDTKDTKDEFRIWIGNLDTKWNEYILLQLLKKYETLKSFDIIRNKAGLHKGQSKGYGFASFSSKQPAEKAIKELHNSTVSGRKVSVKWATEFTVAKQPAPSVLTTPLVVEKSKKMKKESAIEAIERKLKEMKESRDSEEEEKGRMHPLLQQAQVRRREEEARKRVRRNHPYKKKRR